MSEENFNVTIHDESTSNKLALPVDREQLGIFISNLLGQPQSIERELYGTFDIDHEWLCHISALIDQRIRQQNHASLTGFNATIFYEGNLSRVITSQDAFQHYSEPRKILSQGIKIKWTYLISFPNKNVPEKQEISLYVSTRAPAASKSEDPFRRLSSSKYRVGVIGYMISHTERTWGDDVESLLKQQLDLILKEPNFIQSISGIVFGLLAFVFLIGGFIIPEIMNSVIQDKQMAEIFSHYPDILSTQAANFHQIDEKLNLVLKAINPANNVNKVGIAYRTIMMIVGFAMAGWAIVLTEREQPSFVVLTPESKARRDKIINKQHRNYLILVLSFVASIAAGVIGNYVYYIITTKLV